MEKNIIGTSFRLVRNGEENAIFRVIFSTYHGIYLERNEFEDIYIDVLQRKLKEKHPCVKLIFSNEYEFTRIEFDIEDERVFLDYFDFDDSLSVAFLYELYEISISIINQIRNNIIHKDKESLNEKNKYYFFMAYYENSNGVIIEDDDGYSERNEKEKQKVDNDESLEEIIQDDGTSNNNMSLNEVIYVLKINENKNYKNEEIKKQLIENPLIIEKLPHDKDYERNILVYGTFARNFVFLLFNRYLDSNMKVTFRNNGLNLLTMQLEYVVSIENVVGGYDTPSSFDDFFNSKFDLVLQESKECIMNELNA